MEASRLASTNYSKNLTPPARSSVPFPVSLVEEENEQFPSTATALSDTRSTVEESGPKKKEAEKFDFEPWPHASKFGFWKLSFRREVISASSHPTLVSKRLAGIDVATRIEDLDFSRVVFDGHHMELETLDLKDSQRNFGDNSSRVQRKIDVLEETHHKNKQPTLTSRQIMYQIFSFFDSNMTQGRTMDLTDLLDIELHNDNLKALSNRPGKTHYNPWTRRSLKKCAKTYPRDSSKSLHS